MQVDNKDFGSVVEEKLAATGDDWKDVSLADAQDSMFNANKAKAQFAKAKEELQAQGVQFPILIDYVVDQSSASIVQQADSMKDSIEKTLGKENVLPVLCRGAMMSKEDIEGALEQLKDSNHVVLSVNPLDVEAFHFNHKDRCYHCKRSIMSKVIAVAKEHDFAYVLDGKNKDDEKVYRPGLKACEELGIISPLASNNLAKQEIRDYSKQLGIAT